MDRQIIVEVPISLFRGNCQHKPKVKHETSSFLPFTSPEQKRIGPILRKNVQSYPRLETRLLIRGYKYFTKIITSGSQTVEALRTIRGSRQIKFIRRFEFDPYFSDSPGTKELVRVFQKLLSVKDFKVVIRRIESRFTAEKLGAYGCRLFRMKRLCLEVLKVPETEEQPLIRMISDFIKHNTSQYFELHMVNLQCLSEESFKKTITRLRNLYKVEDLKLVMRFTHTRRTFYNDKPIKFPKIPKLKRLRYQKGSDAQWSAMTVGKSEAMCAYVKTFGCCQNLIEFTKKLEKKHLTSEIVLALTEGLSQIPTLRIFNLELQKCNLEELEIMAFAYGVSQIPQLEVVGFKLRQKSIIEIECIYSFVQSMCMQRNLKRFEFYFSKIELSEVEVNEAERMLSGLDQIKFSISQQAISISRHE